MFSIINFEGSIIGRIGRTVESCAQATDRLSIPWHDLQENPSILSMLSWHTRISNFAGREIELGKLEGWALASTAISVKFISGEGGVGKSRLAAEFAKAMKGRGWSAGFIDLRQPKSFRMGKKGALLIIDYPEENRDGVIELLKDLAQTHYQENGRFRVLFLTRQQPGDWDNAINESNASDLVDRSPLILETLDSGLAYCLYLSASKQAANIFRTAPLPLTEDALSGWLDLAPENKRALFILAAAVHSALYPDDISVRYSGSEVVDAVIQRELARLQRIAKDFSTPPYAPAILIAMASIADSMPISKAEEFSRDKTLEIGFPNGVDISSIMRNASYLSGNTLCAPKPDLVAAAFTVAIMKEFPKKACEFVWAALSLDVNNGLQRISRLNYDAEVVLGIHEYRISNWLAEALNGNFSRCNTLEKSLLKVPNANDPYNMPHVYIILYRTILEKWDSLVSAAQDEISQRLPLFIVGDRSEGTLSTIRTVVEYMHKKAQILNNVSLAQRITGDTEGAIKSITEGKEIVRVLVKKDSSGEFACLLGTMLDNLSLYLCDVGDNEGAMKASAEAVKICRTLVQKNQVKFEYSLANSLHRLSIALFNTGKKAEALNTSKKAIKILGKLVRTDPRRYESLYASNLQHISCLLTGDEALHAITAAVEIYQRRAEVDPIGFEPAFAVSLIHLSDKLSDAGDEERALDAITVAVGILQRFSVSKPAHFGRYLRRGLENIEKLKAKLRRSRNEEDI